MIAGSQASILPHRLVVVWLLLQAVLGCYAQYPHTPGAYGGMQAPYVPPIQYPSQPYSYGQRPGYSQGSYGYSSYSSNHMRAADSSEETLDSAQRTAMAPLNTVITSLPARTDLLPMTPAASPVQPKSAEIDYAPQTSSSCGSGSGGCPLAKAQRQSSGPTPSVKNQESPGEQSQQSQQQQVQQVEQATNRQLPIPTTPCHCPCSYYPWLYSGIPMYDFSHMNYQRPTVSPYSYLLPYGAYADKPSTGKSARTFWLPWATPGTPTVQNPLGRPLGYQDGYYNRMYYNRRY